MNLPHEVLLLALRSPPPILTDSDANIYARVDWNRKYIAVVDLLHRAILDPTSLERVGRLHAKRIPLPRDNIEIEWTNNEREGYLVVDGRIVPTSFYQKDVARISERLRNQYAGDAFFHKSA